jgi:hypothetical protein
MAGPALIVFLPTGSREEIDEARRSLRDLDHDLLMCSVSGHTAGQTLYGDVVIVGTAPSAIAKDATGEVHEVRDLKGLTTLATVLASKSAPAAPAAETLTEAIEAEPEPEEKPDPLAGKSRVEVIQDAAKRWPGARSWATLTNEDLAAAVKELEASD